MFTVNNSGRYNVSDDVSFCFDSERAYDDGCRPENTKRQIFLLSFTF